MGMKQKWDAAPPAQRRFAIACGVAAAVAAPFVLAGLEADMNNPQDWSGHAASVEQSVMGAFGGTTPADVCADGIGWACDITTTDAYGEGYIDVHTTLPSWDEQAASTIGRAYLTADDRVVNVTVYDREGVAIDYWTTRDVGR